MFLALGGGLGLVFAVINSKLGARRGDVRADPYECGLPSDYRRGMRFGISFYLVAIRAPARPSAITGRRKSRGRPSGSEGSGADGVLSPLEGSRMVS